MSSGPAGGARPSHDIELDWPALYERHGPELSAFAYRLTGDMEAARDIVQDTFARAIERERSLRDRGAVRAWLYRIAARLVVSRRRRRAILAFVPFAGTERAPEPDADTAALVRTALARIPSHEAVALVLAYHEGLSRAEIASVLDVPEETVRTRIHRGRKSFGAAYRRLERGLAG
ncbi:MAG TPA: RNA polymerase sigma factor [Candidatus Limnocylindria bacterium]|nr:RNA polymerase sigma factor [Candidatus Limnocylindria bacterium]